MKYARVLLSNCPEKTTELFIKYYKGQYTPRTEVEVPSVEPQAQPSSTLQSLAAFLPLPLMNASAGPKPEEVEAVPPQEDKSTEPPIAYQVPKPRTAFSVFVGHPDEFISFLEALIQQENLKEDEKVDLYTTLFEMYLDTASRKKDVTEKEKWEDKAKKLIEGKDVRKMQAPLSPSILTSL